MGLLGGEARLDRALRRDPRLVRAAVREVVHGREAERLRQLPRPPRRGRRRRPGRLPLGGRGRHPQGDHLRLAARADPAGRQRAEVARRRQGRRGRHLHADDPRGRGRDARLHADRRGPQRRLRRLLGRLGRRADGDLRRQGADHRRRDPPSRQADADEGGDRRGNRGPRFARARDRRRPRRHRPADERGPGPSLGRADRGGRPGVPGGADGRRGPPVHPLHVGLDREAEGDPAHHRRLSDRRQRDAQARLRPQGGRRLLVRGRHRLGDRAQLHRLRAARQRGDLGDVRGRSQLSGRGPLVGDRRALRGDDHLHRPDRDPRLHEVGRRARRKARPRARCACSARSASRSTPAPGSGTTRPSAAAAARSSTPGGRPRPARS